MLAKNMSAVEIFYRLLKATPVDLYYDCEELKVNHMLFISNEEGCGRGRYLVVDSTNDDKVKDLLKIPIGQHIKTLDEAITLVRNRYQEYTDK